MHRGHVGELQEICEGGWSTMLLPTTAKKLRKIQLPTTNVERACGIHRRPIWRAEKTCLDTELWQPANTEFQQRCTCDHAKHERHIIQTAMGLMEKSAEGTIRGGHNQQHRSTRVCVPAWPNRECVCVWKRCCENEERFERCMHQQAWQECREITHLLPQSVLWCNKQGFWHRQFRCIWNFATKERKLGKKNWFSSKIKGK